MPVKHRFAGKMPEVAAWRREFHAQPEMGFAVERTAGRVAALLRGFGCDEVVEGIGRTGVVAVIRGGKDGLAVGLRADMDALPIHEATGLPHTSRVPGVMHACGHDGHTAMLLAAAWYLAETRAFAGAAVLMFQPAEEGGGGARAMLADGVMERWAIREVYGLHNMPGLAVGAFAIRAGALMAAVDFFEITLTGRGGHAAQPHLAVDTTLVAGHVLVALQTVVARNVDPLKAAVLTVATIATDSAGMFVIPQVVRMAGTVRTLDGAVQDMIEARLGEVVRGIAQAHGAVAEVRYVRECQATVNGVAETGYAVAVARGISPAVEAETAPIMPGEDFSDMLAVRPGAYMFIGNGASAALHHPGYEFNDHALPYGASWLAGMIEARLAAG